MWPGVAETKANASGQAPDLRRQANFVRQWYRARRRREAMFGEGLFADPAWDIMLDLFAARIEGKDITVSSAGIAACVPPTTALRWIHALEVAGVIERYGDPTNRRRQLVRLTDETFKRMGTYLADTIPRLS